MISWLLKSIGIGSELADRVDEVQWLAARPVFLWLALLTALPLAVLIAARHRASLPQLRSHSRGVLTTCRVAFIVVLLIVLAGPYVRLAEPVTLKPMLAVLLDDSASMSLPAGPFESSDLALLAAATGWIDADQAQADRVSADVRRQLNAISRLDLATQIVQRQADLWASLDERFDVRYHRVASTLRPQDDVMALDTPPSEAEASATALGAAIEAVLGESGGRAMAGIVLLTDGRHTAGPDPLSVLRSRGTMMGVIPPIFAVPVGGSASPGADVAVLDVLCPPRASVGDTVSLIATVGSIGLNDRNVTVSLHRDDETLDEATVRLDAQAHQQVTLQFQAQQTGVQLLRVAVAEQPEEQVKVNNVRNLAIDIDQHKLKVLYLEGYPRWDMRFLDHELRRDHGLEVTMVMESALRDEGVEEHVLPTAARLPEAAAEWAEFDVVVLGDISPSLLPPRWQEQLARAVQDEGVGLLIQAGFQQMPHRFAGSGDTVFSRLLPVTLEPGSREDDLGGLDAPPFAPFRMTVTAEGSLHPALQLYSDPARNRRVWSQMPAFYWAASTGVPKPAATVLARLEEAGQTRPLIAEHFAGRGRVMLIGLDETYRWRRNIGSVLFGRFWSQALRHVARDETRQDDASWLAVSPALVEPDQPVSIELYAVDQDQQPRAGAEVEVTIIDARGNTQRLALQGQEQAGLFRGTWRPLYEGDYRLTWTDSAGLTTTAPFRAAVSPREMLNVTVDREALYELVSASDGAVLELYELPDLVERLEGQAVTIQRVSEDELWDNWLTLLLLAGIYCTDVAVRRFSGLT